VRTGFQGAARTAATEGELGTELSDGTTGPAASSTLAGGVRAFEGPLCGGVFSAATREGEGNETEELDEGVRLGLVPHEDNDND
jgi:hypothetical protein